MTDRDKIVVLSFDEVYIAHDVCYDKAIDQVLGPHKTVQVVMVRGLFKSWKQPVFYSYDTPITASILNNIISKLYNCGYNVAEVTSDMGPTNISLWNSLKIAHTNSSFLHPNTGKNIYVFADVPHLLKLIRNKIIDHGFNVVTENANTLSSYKL